MSDLISFHTPAIRQRGTAALQQVPCLLLEAAAILLLQPVTDVNTISVIRPYNIPSCSEMEKLSPIGNMAAAIEVGALQVASLLEASKKALPAPSPLQTALDYGADALLSYVQETGEYPAKITPHMLKGSQLHNDSNKWTLHQLTRYLLIRNVVSHSRGQTGLWGFTSHTFEDIKFLATMHLEKEKNGHQFRLFSPDNISLKQFYDAAGIDFRYAGFQVATYPLKVKKISASFETLLQATTDSKWLTF